MSPPLLAIILLVGIGIGYRLYGRFVALVRHHARSIAEVVRQGPHRI
jgi:xanthosine utilization system XapX-like protein